MQLLTFLTRKQAWLSPSEIGRSFRLHEEPITSRTIHRWFAFLRAHGGFVYYPYPRANYLGLQDVLVRIHGLRNPDALGVLPFGASFTAEVGLADGHPFVSQAYWVPGNALRAFEEYWEAARDLDLVGKVEMFRTRNTHFFFSPFHEMITADGKAEMHGKVENSYFEAWFRRHQREKFEVRLGDRIAASPLIIPSVVEHIWGHYSSRHVWDAISSKGEEAILAYGKRFFTRALERPGSALRLLQMQWKELLDHFDEVFLQPRVAFDWPRLRNSMQLTVMMHTNSAESMVQAVTKASERSIITAVKPGLGPEGWCHLSCFMPSDQQSAVLHVVNEYHRDRDPPLLAIQDRETTISMFRRAFCKVDWRLFDPATLSWRFEGDAYLERLKELKSVGTSA